MISKDESPTEAETITSELQTYYDHLLYGYLRGLEQEVTFIPEDIKTLCRSYCYIYPQYNELCTVSLQKWCEREHRLEKLVIHSQLDNHPQLQTATDDSASFPCRLVSRLAFSPSSYAIDEITVKMFHTVPEESQWIAWASFFATTTDEMDLEDGDSYTIMQTSVEGWWYAVDQQGDDGWIPCNYLLRDGAVAGLITDPDVFMHAPMTENPFKQKQMRHALYVSSTFAENVVKDGEVVDNNFSKDGTPWKVLCAPDGDDAVISIRIDTVALASQQHGVMVDVDYYFALAFRPRDLTKVEISGTFA